MISKCNYICSDQDSFQFFAKYNWMKYDYIEPRIMPNGKYYVFRKTIDLSNYTLDEIRKYLEPYDYNLESMVSIYGLEEAFHITAECIFESCSWSTNEFYEARYDTLEEAKEKIKRITSLHYVVLTGLRKDTDENKTDS